MREAARQPRLSHRRLPSRNRQYDSGHISSCIVRAARRLDWNSGPWVDKGSGDGTSDDPGQLAVLGFGGAASVTVTNGLRRRGTFAHLAHALDRARRLAVLAARRPVPSSSTPGWTPSSSAWTVLARFGGIVAPWG